MGLKVKKIKQVVFLLFKFIFHHEFACTKKLWLIYVFFNFFFYLFFMLRKTPAYLIGWSDILTNFNFFLFIQLLGKAINIDYGNIDFEKVNFESLISTRS